MSQAALEGLRVLEVQGLFGAYCGKLMADMGAEVILVEPPGGAPGRRQPPFADDQPGLDASLRFAYLNTSKRSVTLDLGTRDGQALFRRLAAEVAVVLDGQPAGWLAARGASVADLHATNPALVYTSITPFGCDTPYSDFAANDLVILAMGGLLSLGGYVDSEPMRAHGDQALLAADQFAAMGTMLAVLQAEATGVGQHVDVSAQECLVMALENAIQFYDLEGTTLGRTGGLQRSAGLGIYPCADGDVYLLANGYGGFWGPMLRWLEDAGFERITELRDPRWLDPTWSATAEARARFEELFVPFSRTQTKAQLAAASRTYRFPLCPVATPADLAASPQLTARDYFWTLPSDPPLRMPGVPYRLSATPARAFSPAPTLGQDTASILGRLGLDAPAVANLAAAGVI